jgi:hypothetical protein
VVARGIPGEIEMNARDDITVVAGGWSVANVAVDQLAGRVIAVNDSALYLPRWDYALSMDRLWAEHRLERVLELSDPAKVLRNDPGRVWMRENAVQNLEHLKHAVTMFRCDNETDEFARDQVRGGVARLNGRSSGGCALNLAWHLRPARVFMLGFDMNRSPRGHAHWYPPYPWSTTAGSTTNGKYAAWAQGFELARKAFDEIRCEVFNVSPSSAIDSFRKITPATYLKVTR